MSTLTLELSEEQMHTLERLAQRRGTSINAMVSEVIADLAAQGESSDDYDVTKDPIYNIAPHETEAPVDLSQHADHYLYGARKR